MEISSYLDKIVSVKLEQLALKEFGSNPSYILTSDVQEAFEDLKKALVSSLEKDVSGITERKETIKQLEEELRQLKLLVDVLKAERELFQQKDEEMEKRLKDLRRVIRIPKSANEIELVTAYLKRIKKSDSRRS